MIVRTYPSLVNTWRSEREVGDVPGYIVDLEVPKWRSSPPVSLSLKGNIIGCGTICYAIVHGERIQLKPVWYSGYL